MKFSGDVAKDTGYKGLHFGCDLSHCLDPEMIQKIFYQKYWALGSLSGSRNVLKDFLSEVLGLVDHCLDPEMF